MFVCWKVWHWPLMSDYLRIILRSPAATEFSKTISHLSGQSSLSLNLRINLWSFFGVWYFLLAGAMRRLWVGRAPSSSLLLLLLTSLGLGSTARPPGIGLLLPLLGFTSSGRPPGAGTEEHTIRYDGDVNIGQCSSTFSLPFIKSTVVPADLYNLDVNRASHLYRVVPPS